MLSPLPGVWAIGSGSSPRRKERAGRWEMEPGAALGPAPPCPRPPSPTAAAPRWEGGQKAILTAAHPPAPPQLLRSCRDRGTEMPPESAGGCWGRARSGRSGAGRRLLELQLQELVPTKSLWLCSSGQLFKCSRYRAEPVRDGDLILSHKILGDTRDARSTERTQLISPVVSSPHIPPSEPAG